MFLIRHFRQDVGNGSRVNRLRHAELIDPIHEDRLAHSMPVPKVRGGDADWAILLVCLDQTAKTYLKFRFIHIYIYIYTHTYIHTSAHADTI